MKIFLSFIIKNATEKKGRLLLLIISILMSTTLLVSSFGLIDVIKDVYASPIREATESMDIGVGSNAGQFFSLEEINTAGLSDFHGEILATGIISTNGDTIYLKIRGKELDILGSYHIINGGTGDFTGSKCIISKRISDEKNIGVGDKLTFAIDGEEVTLVVAAISLNEGTFYMDKANDYSVVVPYSYLSAYFGEDGKYNYLFATSAEPTIQESVDRFNADNPNFMAEKLLDEDSIHQQFSSFSMVLYLMLAVVILVSAIIIFGVFKLIISERLPVIGVFLSQGATKGKIRNVLFLESTLYGLVGSFLGSILGVGVLFIINRAMSPLTEYGITPPFSVNVTYPLFGLFFGVVLALLSSAIPIKSIKRLPVKEVILNDIRVSAVIGWKKFFVGAVFLIISLVGYFTDTDWAINYSPLFLLSSIIGFLLLYPKIIDVVTYPIAKMLKGKSNTIFLALNNVRTSKVLLGNITLIIIAFIASILVSSLGNAMIDSVTAAYEDVNYDITISNILPSSDGESTTSKIVDRLRNLDFVEKNSINPYVYIFGNIGDVKVVPLGVEPLAYRQYMNYLRLNDGKNGLLYDEFSNNPESVVILTDTLKRKIGKGDGDVINVEIGGITNEFRIVGSIDGGTYMDGIFVLMDLDTMQRQYRIREATYITLKTTIDADNAKTRIIDELQSYGIVCTTRQEDSNINLNRNNQMVGAFSLFSYLTIFIAVLGVLNNISISFLQRKKELAVYNSIGMSRDSRILMILCESLSCVIWSAIIVIPLSLISLGLVSKVAKLIGYSTTLTLDISFIPIMVIATTFIIGLASLPTLLRSKKLSISQELKYE